MTIIGLQRRLHEDGRIRIGHQVASGNGRKRPTSLDKFRFTSQNRRAIDAIAGTYGGTAEKWNDAPAGDQWQVVSEATDIPVVVPPEAMSFSQHYELWSGGGCQRRCDGQQDSISDGPCLCDPDNRDCKPHTRLSVMLAQYPGTGLWRLDTGGYYAAVELGGAMQLVDMITHAYRRSVLPGRLRIERRTVKRPDKPTNNFVVPVLDFEVDLAALASGNAAALSTPGMAPTRMLELETGEIHETTERPALTPVPMDESPAPSLTEQLASVEGIKPAPKRAGSTTIPATGIRPRTAEQVAAGERPLEIEAAPPAKATRARKAASPKDGAETPGWCIDLHIRADKLGLSDDQFHGLIGWVTDGATTSTKELVPREAGKVNEALSDIETNELKVVEDGGKWTVVAA